MNFQRTAKPILAGLGILGMGIMPLAYGENEPMQGMDGKQMQDMDHSQMQGMDHSQMQGMKPAAPPQNRTPIPALTDADRAAVFESHAGHQMHDRSINSFFLIDQLEWQDANEGSALRWACGLCGNFPGELITQVKSWETG